MVAILASSIENAGRLSDSLQLYWNSHGVYRSVSLFETKEEFIDVMTWYKCDCVILEGTGGLDLLIGQIRSINPDCKIAVLTDKRDPVVDNQTAILCRNLNVEVMATRIEIERPLEMISKQLCIV